MRDETPPCRPPREAALTAIGAAGTALVALAALHVLRADLDAPSHMISEYAIGPRGWLMTLSFAAFALSSASACRALAPHATTRSGRLGLAFLALASLGLTLGALFPTDPPSTSPEDASFAGGMHGVGFLVGVPSELLSVLLLSATLRRLPRWRGALLLGLTAAMWLSLAVMVPLIVTQTPFFGLPNRTFMLSFAVWLMTAVQPIARPTSAVR